MMMSVILCLPLLVVPAVRVFSCPHCVPAAKTIITSRLGLLSAWCLFSFYFGKHCAVRYSEYAAVGDGCEGCPLHTVVSA
jgi:hypothetical protein